MNWRAICGILGYLWLILGGCLLAPLVVALAYDSRSSLETTEIVAFSVTPVACLLAGWWLQHSFGHLAGSIGRREGFAVVSFAWLTAVLLGMLPFVICGVMNIHDAFFETMSGFTTTGATILGAPGVAIESLPHGLQFWRCMTQWLGGMGIVVLSVALLSFLGVGGYRLLKAETPGGVVFEKERPRISEMAKQLWRLYLMLSLAQLLLLMLAGMTFFDACCHTFTTMSTGGFSPHTESLAFFSPGVQWIVIVFMFLAGMNFALHAQLLRRRPAAVLANPEFRLYLVIIMVVALVGVAVVPGVDSLGGRIRHSLFQVVSIGTTTGYATADFDTWPEIMRWLLVLLMFSGGCMGSTGGGMKVARLLVFAKVVSQQVHRLVYPHAVRPIRIGGRVMEAGIVSNILAFGVLYLLAFACGTSVMAAAGYDLVSSLSAAAAALGNIGPGLGAVGPMAHWGHLPVVAKWVMSLLMLLGRLEIFSVVVLFSSWAWKK